MIAVIVVTKNRCAMFQRCIRSLSGAHVRILVYALKSNDDTQYQAQRFYDTGLIDDVIIEDGTPSLYETFSRGASFARVAYAPDYYLFTADDYEYKPSWDVFATSFLYASPDVSHITLEMEPWFPWAKPISIIERNGVRALQRENVPGANWMFTAARWDQMRDEYIAMAQDKLLDHNFNRMVQSRGLKIAALDGAEHIGAMDSTFGNRAFQVDARPMPPEWRLT